jgi:hypothetical protein
MGQSIKARLAVTWVALSLAAAANVCAAAPANAANEPFFGGPSDFNSLLKEYPKGGPNLSNSLQQLLEANPSLLGSVIAASARANAAQQQEIGKSLADLVGFYSKSDTPQNKLALQQIKTALGNAPLGVLNAFKFDGGESALLKLLLAIEIDFFKEHCVSPSHPHWSPVWFPGGGDFWRHRHCFDHW